MVRHKFKEQREPEGLASGQGKQRNLETPAKQLMRREPDGAVRSWPSMLPARTGARAGVWVAESPQVQAGE